jgi:hypothetical protein
MKNFKSVNKPVVWSMTILMTAIMAGCGGGSSAPAALSGALGTASAQGSTATPAVVALSTTGATQYSITPTTFDNAYNAQNYIVRYLSEIGGSRAD